MAARSHNRRTGSILTAFGVGVMISIISAALLLLPVEFVRVLEISVSDFLFIREGGPLLGTHEARADVVRVLWDEKSRRQLGAPYPSLDQDLALYEALKHAGVLPIPPVQ